MICTLIGFLMLAFLVCKILDMRVWELILLVIIFSILFGCCAQAYEYHPADIVYVGKVVWHEARYESERGQRLVIDTVLNRVESDKFPDTVYDVIMQPGQYFDPEKTDYPPKDIYRLVAEEIYTRTDDRVLYFRTKKYHACGTPITKEGNHYFSGGK